jgi:hypothetical protein
MKIAVLGAAGFTGRAAAIELSRRPEVDELILVDYVIRDAKRLAKVLSPKCRWAMADVGKPMELTRLLKGIDSVANAVGPAGEYEKPVLLACASTGVAAASIGEGALPKGDLDEIHDAFRAAGVPAVAGCGMMPGWTELLAAHFLDAGGPSAGGPSPQYPLRYLFFSPERFGGYAFLRGVARGAGPAVPRPAGAPPGRYFVLPDGAVAGVPEGKAAVRIGGITNTVGRLGVVGKEMAAALLLWLRGGMAAPPGTPAAVCGVARGARSAFVEDPNGRLGSALLAETAVRLASRPPKGSGLLPLHELIGREEAEAIAASAGARITIV